MPQPCVLIDCDPGHDDAIAILLAAVHADVVGITTVSGNAPVEDTTRNALVVCQLLGLDVEVHAGMPRPLLAAPRWAPTVHGTTGLDGPAIPVVTRRAASNDAVRFIIESSHRHRAMWLVALGPLTNVALALRTDPTLASRLAGISLMGGTATVGNVTAVAEFNLWCDPEAAAIVFGAECPVLMSGLDLTHQVLVRPPLVDRVRSLGSTVATFVADLLDFYLDGYAATHFDERAAPLHDPCALLVLTHPHLFERSPRPISMETTGRLTRGMTVVDRRLRTRDGDDPTDGRRPRTEWVSGVDAEGVLEVLVDAISHFG